jgi:hypothetical protein
MACFLAAKVTETCPKKIIWKAFVSYFPTMAKSGKRRWGKEDTAKLTELWRTPHNGVDPTKLDIEDVKAVHHAKYFSEFEYKNFAPLYRDKARDWAVDQTLGGHRASKFVSGKCCCLFHFCYLKPSCFRTAGSKAAQAQARGINLEDISDDEEDPYEGDELIDLEACSSTM